MDLKKTFKLVLFILLILFNTLFLYSSEKWKLVFEKKNIKTYFKHNIGDRSKQYRSEAVIDAPVWSILALMKDISSFPRWNKFCIHSEIIQIKDNITLQYFINKTPWPLKNRDAVLWAETSINTDEMKADGNNGVKIEIALKTLEEPIIPETRKYVRIKDFEGKWILEGIEGYKTKLVYIMNNDFGGVIPDSIGNAVSRRLPYQTISSLEEIVTEKDFIERTKNLFVNLIK